MGLRTSRTPSSAMQVHEFSAAPGVEISLSIAEVVLLMPFFRKNEAGNWIDATGDYDLCLSSDQKKYTFVNRREAAAVFSYRYFSIYWLGTRRLT